MNQAVESNHYYKKLLLAPYKLIGVVILLVVMTFLISLYALYYLGLEEQKKRLSDSVKSRVAMINMIVEYQKIHKTDNTLNIPIEAVVLEQLKSAHNNFSGFGDTGEYTLAKRQGNIIYFLLSHRYSEANRTDSISFTDNLAEPMRRALNGQSGNIIAQDYRGELVVAAHEPIPVLGWGLVAKIDKAEIAAPYIKTGLYGIVGAFLLVLLGTGMVMFFTHPLIKEMERRRRYNRMLFNESSLGLALTDMEGKMLDVNPAFATMLGYSIKEMLKLSYWDITPDIYQSEEKKQLQSLSNSGKYGPYEKEYRHKQGHLLHVRLSGSLVRESGKNYIWSSIEDITAHKRSETSLQEASLVFEHTHEGIMITDADANITRTNKTFTDITGYTFEEVKGKNPSFLQSGKYDTTFYAHMWNTIHTEGIWYGELDNRRKNGEYFATLQSISAVKNTNGTVSGYVSVFADISERKKNEQQLSYLATHDALTTLPNRRHFYDNLKKALHMAKRNRQKVALLFLDLNRFKEVNDTYGHKTGDLLLIEIAKRLTSCVREEDTVARLGGDEFAILLLEVTHNDDVSKVAEKIIHTVEKPLLLDSAALTPSTSIGISIYPEHAQSEEKLLHCADEAMYRAKQGVKSCYVVSEC